MKKNVLQNEKYMMPQRLTDTKFHIESKF